MKNHMNLEPLCAACGRAIIDGKEGFDRQEQVVTKALAVLAENGLYAMTVFLLSLNDKKVKEFGRRAAQHLRNLWGELGLTGNEGKAGIDDAGAMATAAQKIAQDLPRLILARQVTESALVFARYHAKAEIKAGGGHD